MWGESGALHRVQPGRSVRDLLATARELRRQVLATGHYVASRPLAGGGRALYRAREDERDQSYFLFATTHEQLEALRSRSATRPRRRRGACATVRPLGRRQARQPGHLLRAVGPLHRGDRAAQAGRGEPGDIVDIDGRVLGRHPHHPFTVGQRRGFGIARRHPLYVVRLDASSRRVVVGPARRCAPAGCGCARSFGWAMTPSITRCVRAGTRCSSGALHAAAAAGVVSREGRVSSRSPDARTACRRARPACSTTRRRTGARARWRLHPKRGRGDARSAHAGRARGIRRGAHVNIHGAPDGCGGPRDMRNLDSNSSLYFIRAIKP